MCDVYVCPSQEAVVQLNRAEMRMILREEGANEMRMMVDERMEM